MTTPTPARETTEQAIRRISTGIWVKVPTGDLAGQYMAREHSLRRTDSMSTRCSISVRELNTPPADGTRPPCGMCLRSIEADGRMQIPIPGAPGALTEAIRQRDELSAALAASQRRCAELLEKGRILADMLLETGVHRDTLAAVMLEVETRHAADQGR